MPVYTEVVSCFSSGGRCDFANCVDMNLSVGKVKTILGNRNIKNCDINFFIGLKLEINKLLFFAPKPKYGNDY